MKKNLRFLLLVAALLVPWLSQAQLATATYRTGVDASRWQTLTAAATELTFSDYDDGVSPVTDMGLSFWFGDVACSQFSMSTNGLVRFGSTQIPNVGSGSASSPFSASLIADMVPGVAMMGTDCVIRSEFGHYAKYELLGTAPNRIFVLEVNQVPYGSNTATCKYQLQLHEDSNRLVMLYDTASVGFDAGLAIGLALNDTSVAMVNTNADTLVHFNTSCYYAATSWPGVGRYYEFILTSSYSCFPPADVVVHSTADSAHFTWTSSETDFQFIYNTQAFSPDSILNTAINVTGTAFSVGELTANTTYYYALRATCTSDNSYTPWTTGSFRTPCVATGIPYICGFEQNDNSVDCWNHINSNSTDPQFGNLFHDGNYSLLIQVPSDNAYSVLPLLTEPLGNLMLTFYAISEPSSSDVYPLTIGYMTDATNGNTFVPITTVTVPTAWTRYEVSIPAETQYPAGSVLAFSAGGSTSSWWPDAILIDDVVVEMKPTCPAARNLRVSATAGNALAMWDYQSGIIPGEPESYTVVYAPVDNLNDATTVTAYEPTITISELVHSTTYKMWVYPNCGTNDQGHADSAEFTTASFVCADFSRSDTAIIGTGVATLASVVPYNYNYHFNQILYTAAEIGDTGTLNSISFERADEATTTITYANVDILLGLTDRPVLPSGIVPDSTFQMVYSGPLTISGNGWLKIDFATPFHFDGQKNLVVTINTNSEGTWYYEQSHFKSTVTSNIMRRQLQSDYDMQNTWTPDLSYTEGQSNRPNTQFLFQECNQLSSCAAPAVAVNHVTSDSATLSWIPGYTETEWNLYYRITGTVAWQVVEMNVESTTYTLEGLAPATTYDVMVATMCDEGDSMYTVVNFTTGCGIIGNNNMPYFATLTPDPNSYSYTPAPLCWHPYSGNTAECGLDIYTVGDRVNALRIGSDNDPDYGTSMSCIAMPEVETVNNLELVFDIYRNSTYFSTTVMVGVMNHPDSINSFVPIDTIDIATLSTWINVSVPLTGYTGTGKYIAFYADTACASALGSNVAFLSNIALYEYSDCRPLTSVYANNISYDEATINLTGAVEGNDYKVYYNTVPDITSATDMPFSGITSDVITSLDFSTTYYVWAVADCGNEESRPVSCSFTTLPPCLEVENLQIQTSGANASAVLSWQAPTAGYEATTYVVRYRQTSETNWIEDTVQENYYVITGLAYDVEYQCAVTTICDEHFGAENSGTFIVSNDCTVVGANEETNTSIPLHGNWCFSYSQILYTATELAGMGDTISGIYFYNAGTESNTKIASVYIGMTDSTSLAGHTTWVPASEMTLVADSITVSYNGTGWIYLPFDVSFVRNNTKSLIIAVDNNTGSFDGGSPYWAVFNTNEERAFAQYSDSETSGNIDPANPTIAPNQRLAKVPYIRFASSCLSETPCAAPILLCTGTTGTSIDLRWFPGTNDSVWSVMYRVAGDATWTTVLTNTTLTSTTISNLQSGVSYEVRVTNYCSTDDNFYAQSTFNTGCEGLAFPYIENFEAQFVGEYSRACWLAGTTNTDEWSAQNPFVEEMGSYSKMGVLTNGGYLVAPTFATPIQNTMVNVTYWSETDVDAIIEVGVMIEAGETNTFMPIDTLTVTDISTRHSATIRFDSYTDTIGRIYFQVPIGCPDYGYGYMYIDDIEFRNLVNCGSVSNIAMTNNSSSTIDIAWTVDGTMPTNFIVEYGATGFTRGQGTVINTTTTAVTLTGLASSSMYDVYVTPVCGTDTLFSSVAIPVYTACEPMSIPYAMNFELSYLPPSNYTGVLPLCWSADNLNPGEETPEIATASYAISGDYTIRMSDIAVVALPEFNVPIDSLQVSFFASCGDWSNYSLEVGVVDSITPGFMASFQPFATVSCRYGVYDTVNFCGYTGSGRYIAFRNVDPNGYGYATIFIDDVVVDYRSFCLPVTNVTTSNLMLTSLSLNWDACGVNNGYEVRYALNGSDMSAATSITTTTNQATITGLLSDSTYMFQVRNYCANGDTGSWVTITQTMPPCDGFVDAALYNTNASAGSSNYIPGYTNYNYSYSQVVYDSAMLAQKGLNGVEVNTFAFHPLGVGDYSTYFDSCNIYIKNTTRTAFADNSDFEIMTAANLVYTGSLNWTEVGWRTVTLDSTFTWDGHSNIVIAIDRNHGDWTGSASFLAYSGNDNQAIYHYSDDANLDPANPAVTSTNSVTNTIPAYHLSGCPSNFCSEAPAVTVDAITPTTADISWTSAATNFEVNIKSTAEANWPATDIAVNAAHTYSFTGLVPATTYQYRVRAICEEGETSDWAVATLTTDSLPCFVPTNLAAAPAMGSAEMSWTAGSDETAWNIRVWNTAFDQTFNATANPFSVTGLTPGTTYNAAIQSVCGGGVVTSEFSETITFTTDVCDPVTNVTATANGTTATVTWTAGENNTGSFAVEYGYEGFAAGTGTTVNATSTTVTLTDLESDTRYDVYVRAICDGQYNSTWSAVANFQTEVGINTANGNNNVNIYPNPAENSTTISVSGVEGEVTVTIVDMNGRTVSTATMECNGDCEKMMNVDNLAAGNYFVRLQGNGLNTVKKLVIK